VIVSQQLRRSRSAGRGDGQIGDVTLHPGNLTEHIHSHAAKQMVCHLVGKAGMPGKFSERHGAGQIEDLQREFFEH